MVDTIISCLTTCWLQKAQPNAEHALRAYRDFYNYNRFRKKSFTSIWWLSSKVKALNFTENKLLKLVNSMKADFLYAGVNANITIKKNDRKRHILRIKV